MDRLIKSLHPNFPEDRHVVATSTQDKWFKINFETRTLFVPEKRVLQSNLMLVDPFMDSLANFAHTSLDYDYSKDWDSISFTTDNGGQYTAIKLIQELSTHKVLSCDIETDNVRYTDNKVLSIGFSFDEVSAKIITLCYNEDVRKALNTLFARKDITFIWHNGKFDTTRLKWLCNIDARIDEDTMLMHYAGINEKRGTHSLKELGKIYLQAPAWDDELDKIKKQWCLQHKCKLADFKYGYLKPEVLFPYQARDCVATLKLSRRFPGLMRENSQFIYRKLIEASNAYKQVELNGSYIDVNYLEDLEYDLETQIAEAEKEIHQTARAIWKPEVYAKAVGARAVPRDGFNYKSPKQLKWLLETTTGKQLQSTDKKALDALFAEVGDQYPVINAIKKMRKLSKYMDTYVQGFRDVLCNDNRIHCSFNLHGTETGRLSSSDPNMQNVPRDALIKNLVAAPDGCILVQADYSQAELRVLAYLSKDKFLTGVYQRGEDLHDAVATQMFGPDFTKEQRVKAKTINFGIAYGRGPASLQETFGISKQEATDLINNWFASMPDVKKYISDTRQGIYRNISPVTVFGRERHFVITLEKIYHIQNEMVNFAIQSIASDLTLFSLIELQHWIEEQGLELDVKISLSVHDSIILEVTDDPKMIKMVADKCKEVMSSLPARMLPNCEVPFRADVDTGYRWGEMHACEL